VLAFSVTYKQANFQHRNEHPNMCCITNDKPCYFFWEVLECLRKLLLTGVAVTINPGSLIQLVASLAVIVVYAVAVVHYKPYKTARDNTLALVLYSMLAGEWAPSG
jgi:hypothetical protein